jgi:hypothetical protein
VRIIANSAVVDRINKVYQEKIDKWKEILGAGGGKWLNSLQKIRELKPSVVIPGHSKVGAPLDASTAVDFTENYLLVFEEELKKAKDPDSLINAMKENFPSSDLRLAIERGAKANVKP